MDDDDPLTHDEEREGIVAKLEPLECRAPFRRGSQDLKVVVSGEYYRSGHEMRSLDALV
jgi:hypothetical protein